MYQYGLPDCVPKWGGTGNRINDFETGMHMANWIGTTNLNQLQYVYSFFQSIDAVL
jgi:hypothetical protein